MHAPEITAMLEQFADHYDLDPEEVRSRVVYGSIYRSITTKSLFGNLQGKKAITVLKADQATSQMQEGLIGKIQLLPAH